MSEQSKYPRKRPTAALRLKDPALQAKVEDDYDAFLKTLKMERERFAKNRFTETDRRLGRTEGFISDILRGHTALGMHQFFAFLALVDRSPHEFFGAMRQPPRIPESPSEAYLNGMLKPKRRRFAELYDWARMVTVGPGGHEVSVEPELVTKRASVSRSEGLALARKYVDLLVALQPDTLCGDSAANVCRLLAATSAIYRGEADYDAAKELLHVAFLLEPQVGSFEIRSILYRNLSSLICYLGHIDEAEHTAKLAVELCTAAPTREGLGEALYVRAMMAKWSGAVEDALHFMRASVAHLENASLEFEKYARLSIVGFLMELDRLEEAESAFELEANSLDSLPNPIKGRALFFRAMLRSLKGDRSQADSDFEAADDLLSTANATDQAILLLYRSTHCLRFGLLDELGNIVHRLPGLASELPEGSSGEAALLEIARIALGKRLEVADIQRAIAIVERPWARLQQPRAS